MHWPHQLGSKCHTELCTRSPWNVYAILRKPSMKAHAQLWTSRVTASRQASTATCLNRSPSCSAAKVFKNLMVRRHQRWWNGRCPSSCNSMLVCTEVGTLAIPFRNLRCSVAKAALPSRLTPGDSAAYSVLCLHIDL